MSRAGGGSRSSPSLLALAGIVEGLVVTTVDGVSRGPGWLLPLVVIFMAIPLLFVKRFPFAAPVATVLIAMAIAIFSNGRTITDGFIAIFLLFLVAWLFGQLDRRSSVMGLVLLFTAVVVVDTQADEVSVGNVLFPWVFFALFWGASAFVTAREGEARKAEDRAEQLAVEQETASLRAVAEERQRIARELHDVIAHSVSVMTVQAGAVRRLLLPEQERERQALETVESTGREALTEMRRLVGLLREQGAMPEFTPQPSLRTLDILIGTVREAGLDVELEIQGDERELPPGVDLSAYRLVQEALTNTLKYAGPARAWVTLRWRERSWSSRLRTTGAPSSRRTAPATALPACASASRSAAARSRPGRGTAAALLFVVIYHWSPPHDRESADRRRPVARPGRVPDDPRCRVRDRGGRRGVGRARGRPCRTPTEPDVILMDVRMPNVDGLEATRRLLDGRDEGPRILILTTFDLDEYVYEALRAGASGFLLKDTPPEQLVEAIMIVARGDALLAPSITRRVIEEFVRRPPASARKPPPSSPS